MSFGNFIEKIQNKPRRLRVQILWLSVSLAMFFIVSGWVISLKHSLSLTGEENETPKTEESANLSSLLESLKAGIGSFFQKDQEESLDAPENNLRAGEEEVNSPSVEDKVEPAVLPLGR